MYSVRNYRPEDFKRFVLLRAEAERLEPCGLYTSPLAISEQIARPGFLPGKDIFVVEIARNLIGYANLKPERVIKRVLLDCWIQPEHRRKGLAKKLLDCTVRRARELGMEVVHVNIAEDNSAAKSVLSKLGFRCVRKFFILKLDMARVDWGNVEQVALDCRHLLPGEEKELAEAQNRAFAGSWGFNPNTAEEIAYCTHLSQHSPQDVILAHDEGKIIGYCWTEPIPAGHGNRGKIFMLGVDPAYRGKGIGKRVLLAGLAYLKTKDVPSAELTVDSGNTVAVNLYRSLGFEVEKSSLWYEKNVGQGTGAK